MNDISTFLKNLNRQRMYEIWQYAKNDNLDQLSEEEQKIGELMLDHQEYHNQFEFADALGEHIFDTESEVNPFLHILTHVIVEDQLKTRDPIEVFQFYNSMRKKKASHHETIHLIGNMVIPLILHVVRKGKPFDDAFYRHLLKKYKDRKPDKIYSALQKELQFIFD